MQQNLYIIQPSSYQRVGYHPSIFFPKAPKPKWKWPKSSNVDGLGSFRSRHIHDLSNLKYILYCHFDEKKVGRYSLGDKVSRQRKRVWGWLPPEKIKSRYFETFWPIGYFELGRDYDVTVTSHLGCLYLFWYVLEEGTPSYTMVPIICIWGVSFLSS